MSEGLVSRLLAHLDKVEAGALEAAKYSTEAWSVMSSCLVDMDTDWPQVFDSSPIAHHVAEHDPAAVLRLVRAHRDIAERAREALYCIGDDGRVIAAEARAENFDRDAWEAHEAAAEPWQLVVAALARGYGLEDQT